MHSCSARSSGTARRAQLNCPVRQISRQRSQSSGFMSSTFDVGPAMPALLTSTSRPPSFEVASAKRLRTAARSDTSHRDQEIAGSLAVSADNAGSSTSQVWTLAPSPTNARAIASPMPPAPAVTRTRKPLMSRFMVTPGSHFAIQFGAIAAVRGTMRTVIRSSGSRRAPPCPICRSRA